MLAFDMSSSFVHIVQCSTSPLSSGVKVSDAFSIPMPPQAIRNGFVTNTVSLSKEIRDELLRRNIMDRNATVVLNSSTIKTKDLEVMATSESIIIELMQKDISEIIVDEEHLIDYMVQRSYKKNKVPFLYCTLVAIPYSLLSAMGTVFREARMSLKKMDTHLNVVSKLWELENPGVRNVGVKSATPVVPKKLSAKKTKELASAGNEMAEVAEAELMQNDQFSFEIPITPPVKLRVGIYKDEIKLTTNGVSGSLFNKSVVIGGDENNPYSDVDLALDLELSPEERAQKEEENRKFRLMQYMQNISSFVAFHRSLNNGTSIEEIQVYGDEASVPSICNLIQSVVEIPTVLLVPPKGISVPPNFDFARYSCAIGAVIRR